MRNRIEVAIRPHKRELLNWKEFHCLLIFTRNVREGKISVNCQALFLGVTEIYYMHTVL